MRSKTFPSQPSASSLSVALIWIFGSSVLASADADAALLLILTLKVSNCNLVAVIRRLAASEMSTCTSLLMRRSFSLTIFHTAFAYCGALCEVLANGQLPTASGRRRDH